MAWWDGPSSFEHEAPLYWTLYALESSCRQPYSTWTATWTAEINGVHLLVLKENKYNSYKLFCSDKGFEVSDAEPGLHDPVAHIQAQQEEVCTEGHWIRIIQCLKLSHNPPQQVPAVGTGHSGSTALRSDACAEPLPLTYQCFQSVAWQKSHQEMTSGSIWFQGNAEHRSGWHWFVKFWSVSDARKSCLLLRWPLPLIHNCRKVLLTWHLPQTQSNQGPHPTWVEMVQIHNPKWDAPLQQPQVSYLTLGWGPTKQLDTSINTHTLNLSLPSTVCSFPEKLLFHKSLSLPSPCF